VITAERQCTRSFATATPSEICGAIYLVGVCGTVAVSAGVGLAEAIQANSRSYDDDVSEKVWRVITSPLSGAAYGIATGAVWPAFVPVYAYYSWRGRVQQLQREQADEDHKNLVAEFRERERVFAEKLRQEEEARPQPKQSNSQPRLDNYYQSMGVTVDASQEAIEDAFRRHDCMHDPIYAGHPVEAQQRFKQAYFHLRDPRRRATYDLSLASASGSAHPSV
jgi:hypothetical protein